MIQRIQTIWLFLTSVAGLLAVLLPVAGTTVLFEYVLNSILALAIILPLATIFLYKNRKLQIKLCYAVLILFMLLYILYGIFFALYPTTITASSNGVLLLWGALPLIAILLDVLAIRAIKKDEKLVRSLDRLR